METSGTTKKELISRLKKEILMLEGFKVPEAGIVESFGLEQIEAAFPNSVFPFGAIHEFLSFTPEQAAACSGFIAGLVKTLISSGSVCLWISFSRKLFPPALKAFGVDPDRIIFIDLQREKDVLWAMEEALKCEGLAAVIAEVGELDFAQSRRLQLTVERSHVTGFVLRTNPLKISPTACVARWKITPAKSELDDGLPGVGFPRWTVELQKVRNGSPGVWEVEWVEGRFTFIKEKVTEVVLSGQRQKAG